MNAVRMISFAILMFALGCLVAKVSGSKTVKIFNREISIGAIVLALVHLISIGVVIMLMYIEHNKWQ